MRPQSKPPVHRGRFFFTPTTTCANSGPGVKISPRILGLRPHAPHRRFGSFFSRQPTRVNPHAIQKNSTQTRRQTKASRRAPKSAQAALGDAASDDRRVDAPRRISTVPKSSCRTPLLDAKRLLLQAKRYRLHRSERLGDAFRRIGLDENAIAAGYADALAKLQKGNADDAVEKSLLDILKECARILEPPRPADRSASIDVNTVVQLVHKVDRPLRRLPERIAAAAEPRSPSPKSQPRQPAAAPPTVPPVDVAIEPTAHRAVCLVGAHQKGPRSTVVGLGHQTCPATMTSVGSASQFVAQGLGRCLWVRSMLCAGGRQRSKLPPPHSSRRHLSGCPGFLLRRPARFLDGAVPAHSRRALSTPTRAATPRDEKSAAPPGYSIFSTRKEPHMATSKITIGYFVQLGGIASFALGRNSEHAPHRHRRVVCGWRGRVLHRRKTSLANLGASRGGD